MNERAALVAATFATDADDLRLLLDALGLLPDQPAPQQREVPAHEVHSRARRIPGCARCRDVHARYVAAWRRRGGSRRVTSTGVVVVVLTTRSGRGRRAAYPGQLALAVKETA